MPRLLIRSVEFEGPLYDTWPPATHRNIFIESPDETAGVRPEGHPRVRHARLPPPDHRRRKKPSLFAVFEKSLAERSELPERA